MAQIETLATETKVKRSSFADILKRFRSSTVVSQKEKPPQPPKKLPKPVNYASPNLSSEDKAESISDEDNNPTSINSDRVAEPIDPFIAQTESSTITKHNNHSQKEKPPQPPKKLSKPVNYASPNLSSEDKAESISDEDNNPTSINSDRVAEPIEPFIAQTESSTITIDDSLGKTEFINSGNEHKDEPTTEETQEISPEKFAAESCNATNESSMAIMQLSADIHPKDEQDSSAVKNTQESSLEIAPNECSIPKDSITKDAEPDKPENVSEDKTVLVEEPILQNIPEDPAKNNVAHPEHEVIVDIPMMRSNVIPAPHKGNFATIANKTPLEKKTKPSVLEDRKMRLPPSRSSQSSLSSLGPSSSSLCHLTELSQPKPETLQTTLMCLRHLHGKNAQHLGSIERHLRGLRNNPKQGLGGRKRSNDSEQKRKMNAPARPLPAQSNEDEEREPSPSNRQIFDRFAGHLFEHLERKRAQQNYETTKLMMPVQIGYYSAAYDALVETFGHSYHKCTLELYQHLAAELGLEAEMFVIDKTPKTNQGDEGLELIEHSNFTDDQMLDFIGRH